MLYAHASGLVRQIGRENRKIYTGPLSAAKCCGPATYVQYLCTCSARHNNHRNGNSLPPCVWHLIFLIIMSSPIKINSSYYYYYYYFLFNMIQCRWSWYSNWIMWDCMKAFRFRENVFVASSSSAVSRINTSFCAKMWAYLITDGVYLISFFRPIILYCDENAISIT